MDALTRGVEVSWDLLAPMNKSAFLVTTSTHVYKELFVFGEFVRFYPFEINTKE